MWSFLPVVENKKRRGGFHIRPCPLAARQTSAGAYRMRPYGAAWLHIFCNHSISISVCFGSSFLASALGRCRVRMPFSNLALMSLGSSSLPT